MKLAGVHRALRFLNDSRIKGREVWLVIRYIGDWVGEAQTDPDIGEPWQFEIAGAFSSKERAEVAVAKRPAGESWGYGPLPLDVAAPIESTPWPGFRWVH